MLGPFGMQMLSWNISSKLNNEWVSSLKEYLEERGATNTVYMKNVFYVFLVDFCLTLGDMSLKKKFSKRYREFRLEGMGDDPCDYILPN